MPLYSCLFFFFLYTGLSAQVLQNLVKNPSFEQYKTVPKELGDISALSSWSSATAATPDAFNKRSPNPLNKVPKSRMGLAEPRSGLGYAGIYAYTSRYSKRNFREYIQVELKQPMLMNERYCISAWVYLAESSNRALPSLHAKALRFTWNKDVEDALGGEFSELLPDDRKNLTQRKWVRIRGIYKALGGERHLALGNFLADKDTKVTGAIEIDSFRNPNVDFAYYFIDDVCVTGLSTNFDCDCGTFDHDTNLKRERIILDFGMQRKDYRLGEDIVLYGLHFEPKKALFRSDAFRALEDLKAVLDMNPKYEIEISGHTSDRGKAEENQELSKRRAKAVYDYLVASGVAESRLSYRGYGQSRPLTHNKDALGRERNERMQIHILKK